MKEKQPVELMDLVQQIKNKNMKIKEKIQAIRDYFDFTRQVGHTTLMKKGIDNYDKDKLVLTHKKEEYDWLGLKPTEVISWHNLNALKGNKKPLVIDNGILWLMLNETIEYINELEKDREELNKIKKIIKNEN